MAQWEGLGAGRRGDVRREGGGGAVTWEGARRRSDASDVCVVLRVERSSRRSPSRPALSSSGGAPWGEVECHAFNSHEEAADAWLGGDSPWVRRIIGITPAP